MTDTPVYAREVVAREICDRYMREAIGCTYEVCQIAADVAAETLRPIIAAEIQAWAEQQIQPLTWEDVWDAADAIAARICGEGEQ